MKENEIYNENCLDIISNIPDNFIDCIITDPPYKIVANKRKKGTGFYHKTDHLANIDESFGTDFNPIDFLNAVKNKFKNSLLIWHSKDLLKIYIDWAEINNLKWDLMFWHKSNAIPNHFNHLIIDTEYCIRIFKKGAYFNNSLEYKDYKRYFIYPVQENYKGHPTPKPLDIFRKQILLFSKENDLIADFFIGTGTLAIACIDLKRNYIGSEISKKYYEIAEKRIKEYSAQQIIKF